MSTPAIKDGGPVTKVCFGSAPYACVFSLSVSQCCRELRSIQVLTNLRVSIAAG